MFRMFKEAHLRILNQMQVEINEIQKRLTKLDVKDMQDPLQRYRLYGTTPRVGEGRTVDQKELLTELKDALKEYRT